jgi:hypothetical protein
MIFGAKSDASEKTMMTDHRFVNRTLRAGRTLQSDYDFFDGFVGCDRRVHGVRYRLCALASVLLACLVAPAHGAPAAGPANSTLRCGWFENPTPANARLNDKDGHWVIGVQGGHQAEGDWPTFGATQWVNTNGNYGHGCACLRVHADAASRLVTRIVNARSRPLAVCRGDAHLREPKD